jgi:TRAP-type C4-dicarboxylate transport system substrate-binding protein
MRKTFRLIIVALILLAGRVGAVEIKLASSLPRNSDWGIILDRIAAEWYQATNGEVVLNILHQRPGSEEEYLRQLRQDRFQAAVFTSNGLYNIAPEIMALSIPFLIHNNEEFDAVLREVRPILDAKIEENGFKNMVWVKAGWVKIFSRSPIFVPDDLRKLKLASDSGTSKISDAFRRMGFQLVDASMDKVPVFLTSGRIDAMYQSPISIQATQIYKVARHMSSVNLAPCMGGVLMNRQGWGRIPERYRDQLQEIIRRAGMEFEESFYRREAQAIDLMIKDGVILNQAVDQIWLDDIGPRIETLVNDNVFDKPMYLRIQGILQRHRGTR